jgi:putative DNA primase/helicase
MDNAYWKIPTELRDLSQWVCWRLEDRGGKATKIPASPLTGKPASSTDPATWATFSEAVAAVEREGFSGIGFVFSTGDPFTGIDLDHVRDPETKAVEPWAREIVNRLKSYAELSQSGTGAHIIIRGKVPGDRRRKGNVEMYDAGRFFVMTGKRLSGCPPTVEDRQTVLDEIHAEIFGADERALPGETAETPPTARPAAPLSLSDRELIEKASAAKNGATFSALWRGDWKGAGYGSQSEADAALLGLLRFWTGGDKARAFALFSQSGLNREKWEREDYREKTWATIATGETYSPPRPASLGGSRSSVSPATDPAEPVEIEEAAVYEPFPVDALPEPHRGLVVHGAESIGCDPALIALPLLAATAGAIGNARRIMLKRGWTEPAVLWAVTVALSGDRKSPAFELGVDGLMQIEERAFAEYRAALDEHKRALQAWKDAGGSGAKPEPPTATRFIVRDVTVEGLALVLSENTRGLMLARDELSAWVGGFDRYTGGKGEESAHWLEMYRAGKVTVDRKTGDKKTVHVPKAAVSISGTIQPGTLERVLERRHFENGLAARLLLAWPPRQLRQWNEAEIDERLLIPVRRVFERLAALPMGADGYGNPTPIDLMMTPEGKARWIAFYNEHGEEMHGLGDDRLSAAWSKLEGTTARFALLVHCVRAAAQDDTLRDAAAVDRESIEAAIRLVTWFKNETRRIYGRMAESEDTRDARKVLECVEAKGGRATVRDVAKAGLCRGDTERIAEVLDKLAEAGFGVWQDVNPTARGGRRTRAFELTPETPKTGETPEKGETDTATPPAKPSKPAKPPTDGEVSPETPVSGTGFEPEKQVSPVSPVSGTGPEGEIEEGAI